MVKTTFNVRIHHSVFVIRYLYCVHKLKNNYQSIQLCVTIVLFKLIESHQKHGCFKKKCHGEEIREDNQLVETEGNEFVVCVFSR